jgi:hypothetical protein
LQQVVVPENINKQSYCTVGMVNLAMSAGIKKKKVDSGSGTDSQVRLFDPTVFAREVRSWPLLKSLALSTCPIVTLIHLGRDPLRPIVVHSILLNMISHS